MKRGYWFYALVVLCLLACATGCLSGAKTTSNEPPLPVIQERQMGKETQPDQKDLNQRLQSKYTNVQPQQWGEKVSGVAFDLDTDEKVLALTFDACGGSTKSNGYDAALINYLDKMEIPATLFVTGTWIDANQGTFLKLAQNDLFEMGNHGLNHLPCSINGKSAYNIKGTASVSSVIQEVNGNGQKIAELTWRKPIFYRSGTNYYDEVAVDIARDLGYQAVGYSVLGDAGATFNREQVKKALLGAQAGSIVIFHFNHPEGDTCEGIMEAIPILKDEGFRFVKLEAGSLRTFP